MAKSPMDGRRSPVAFGSVRGIAAGLIAAGVVCAAPAFAQSKRALAEDGAATAVAAAKPAAEKDTLYPGAQQVCGSDGKALLGEGLGVFRVGSSMTLLPVPAGYAAKSGTECAAKATAANLNIQFPGQDSVLLEGPVSYSFAATREVQAGVIEPTLCHSYYEGSDKLKLRLTDSNREVDVLGGVASLGYQINNARFVPESTQGLDGPELQCYTFDFASLQANPPVIPPAQASNTLFKADFEGDADLVVDMLDEDGLLAGEIHTLVAAPFTYRIRLTNQGEGPAAGVRVEEFVPKNIASPLLTPVVDAGQWSCARTNAASCGIPGNTAGTGTGVLAVDGLVVDPGDEYIFTVTRTVPTGAVGASTVVGAAAFFDPSHATARGDKKTADNSRPLVVTLVSNNPPVIACVDENDAPMASPIALQEDGGVTPTYTCSVTDQDEDAIASFVVQGNTNTALLPTAGLLAPLGNDEWTLTLAPEDDTSGTATITLRATDAVGGTRDLQFTVNVAEVNDAPSFDLVSNTAVLSVIGDPVADDAGVPIEDQQAGVIQHLADNCFDNGSTICGVEIENFVQAVDAGPANESTQTVAPLNSICTRTDTTGTASQLFASQPTLSPAGAQPSGSNFTLAWTFKKNAPTDIVIQCVVRVQDSGTPAATSDSAEYTTVTFSFGAPEEEPPPP